MRIDVAVRTLEAQHQRPALACMHDGARRGRRIVARPLREPRKRHPPRDRGAGGQYAFDRERESRAVVSLVRQVVDDAGDAYVAVLPRNGHRIGETEIGAPGGVAEAQRRGSSERKRERQRSCERHRRARCRCNSPRRGCGACPGSDVHGKGAGRRCRARRDDRERPGRRRQLRARLQRGRADRESGEDRADRE